MDYRDVVACVREVSDGRAFQLLETLAAAVADELMRALPGLERPRRPSASPSSSSSGGRATVTAER